MRLRHFALLGIGVGFGVGAGFAVTNALLTHGQHSKHVQDGWNRDAVTATFRNLDVFEDTMEKTQSLSFTYTLENHSNNDYRFSDGQTCELFVKDPSGHLTAATTEGVLIPIVIPAKSKTTLTVVGSYAYSKALDKEVASKDPPDEQDRAYCQIVRKERAALAGFVFFDETHRYRIELPQGW